MPDLRTYSIMLRDRRPSRLCQTQGFAMGPIILCHSKTPISTRQYVTIFSVVNVPSEYDMRNISRESKSPQLQPSLLGINGCCRIFYTTLHTMADLVVLVLADASRSIAIAAWCGGAA